MHKKTEDMTLDEKVDLLLKWHKQARFWAFLRGIITLTLFIVFVVLPLIYSIKFIREFVASGALENAKTGFNQIQNLNGGLSDFIKNLGK